MYRFIILISIYLIYSSFLNVTFCVSEQESLQKLLDERDLLDIQIQRIRDRGGVTILKDNEISSPCSKITVEPSSSVKKYVGASIILDGFFVEDRDGQPVFRTTHAVGKGSLNSLRELLPNGVIKQMTYQMETLSPEFKVDFKDFNVDVLLRPTVKSVPLLEVKPSPPSPRISGMGGELFKSAWEGRTLEERLKAPSFSISGEESPRMNGALIKHFYKRK
jgi:hypothetical protein